MKIFMHDCRIRINKPVIQMPFAYGGNVTEEEQEKEK